MSVDRDLTERRFLLLSLMLWRIHLSEARRRQVELAFCEKRTRWRRRSSPLSASTGTA
jgi:hypothetical protein